MPTPPSHLMINEPSSMSVRCLWFVGYVNNALPEPARSDLNNLVYAEYGPPILRRPDGEAITLAQLSQSAAWESKTTDDIRLAMVRAQLAAKRQADQTAAAGANENAALASIDEDYDPRAAPLTGYIYQPRQSSLAVLETTIGLLNPDGPTSAVPGLRGSGERRRSARLLLSRQVEMPRHAHGDNRAPQQERVIVRSAAKKTTPETFGMED